MPAPHVIVLAVDGLRATALGAYGNTWRPTPALDRLACESAIGEWAYSQTGQPEAIYDRLSLESSFWGRTRLVTDDESIAKVRGTQAFAEATLVDLPMVDRLAENLSETTLATSFAAFADAVTINEQRAESDKPLLTWLHCRGFAGHWDAPTSIIEQLVEEDDPMPELSVAPATGSVDRQADPDAIFAATCRYAAQVAVLDACLEGWLEVIDEVQATGPDQPLILVLIGLRGYSLGEHNRIGLEEAGPYGESRHVPLLVRYPGLPTGVRLGSGLIAADDIGQLLTPLAAASSSDELLAGINRRQSEHLCLHCKDSSAVRTSEWLLVQRPAEEDSAELYLKPDDRWEANDVASRRPEVVDELQQLIAATA